MAQLIKSPGVAARASRTWPGRPARTLDNATTSQPSRIVTRLTARNPPRVARVTSDKTRTSGSPTPVASCDEIASRTGDGSVRAGADPESS